MKLNALQLALSFHRGGRKNAIKTLARGLLPTVECHLCCLNELGCEPDEVAPLFRSVTVLERDGSGHLSAVRQLAALCRQHQITLIHAHDAASQFVASLVRVTRPGIKVIMTFHRSLGFESARPRDRLRNAVSSGLSAAIVTGSTERREHFLAQNYVSKKKLTVIPFGIDTATFCPNQNVRAEIRSRLNLREESVVVGAVGHFGPEKGIDVAVAAFGAMCERAPERDTVLVVLGDGAPEQRARLGQVCARLPEGKVILAGFQTNIRDWYSAFDVFLHAPRQEAFGLVVIEAMATKLPIVAARVGGIPDIIRHEETGYLCPPEDPGALAGALVRLVRDPNLCARFGAAGLDRARAEYSADLYTERYLDLYRRVLSGRPLRPLLVA